MQTSNVRIAKIGIQNFKNVISGDLPLDNSRKNYRASVVGLYGQNGSGKTAIIDAVELLKISLCGQPIPDRFADSINIDSSEAVLSFDFHVDTAKGTRTVTYEFGIKCSADEIKQNTGDAQGPSRKVIFTHEIIKCPILSEKQVKTGRLIDTDGDNVFSPRPKRKLLAGNDKNVITELVVAKKICNQVSRSFVFSVELLSVIRKRAESDRSEELQYYVSLIESLVEFGNHCLFVIKTENSGLISLNALPIMFRHVEQNVGTIGEIVCSLDNPFTVPQKVMGFMEKIINGMNIVLEKIVPGLTVSIRDLGKQVLDNGETGVLIQLMSEKNGKKIPLRSESEGIKKIFSILQLLIVVYNQSSVTVAIDELDSGIFEYLLGEILRIISEKGKGQLIFTSHNLRPLETLDRGFIAFTTTNPANRYIRLVNVKENNNLRDFYYRDIMLGEQNEPLYESTNNSEIAIAFREAGEMCGA